MSESEGTSPQGVTSSETWYVYHPIEGGSGALSDPWGRHVV